MTSLRGAGRGGMQVHAVPEAERAFDSAGRQLPWGIEYADAENLRRAPEEKGPFGKSMRRRGLSRSKTFTPAKKEDQARIDNSKTIDDIFGTLKRDLKSDEAGAAAAAALNAQVGPLNPTSIAPLPPTQTTAPGIKEPTEVLLYGFGKDFQWSALEFYERVSGGVIYEDYERTPPHSRYNLSLSQSRASAASRSLTAAARRKKNQYVGGDHWIKVTFDSPDAAGTAVYSSPHVLNGFAVYAELYRGVGPREDVAIPATREGLNSLHSSPTGRSSATLQEQSQGSPSSATASSTTATASAPATIRVPHPLSQSTFPPHSNSTSALPQTSLVPSSQPPTLRIRGAKPIILKPAEEALLPVVPGWQKALAGIPILGGLVGGSSSMIGNQVPRKEDGTFDYDNASMYWRLTYAMDSMYGMDLCGLRGDDE